MPGRDGTGPRGLGPLTGRGEGYCVMRVPDNPDQPKTGYVGLSGRPVALRAWSPRSDRASSSAEIAGIRDALLVLGRRIHDLETSTRKKNADPNDVKSRKLTSPREYEP